MSDGESKPIGILLLPPGLLKGAPQNIRKQRHLTKRSLASSQTPQVFQDCKPGFKMTGWWQNWQVSAGTWVSWMSISLKVYKNPWLKKELLMLNNSSSIWSLIFFVYSFISHILQGSILVFAQTNYHPLSYWHFPSAYQNFSSCKNNLHLFLTL